MTYNREVKNSSFRVGTLVALVVILAVVAFLAWNSIARNSAPPDTVRIGASAQQITGLVAIADKAGDFLKEKVAAQITQYKSGQLALADLEAGKVDIATVAETPIALDGFKRDDLRVIATIGSTDKEEKVVARADHGIAVPSDLKGKKIATQKQATSPHFFLHLFLTKYGMSDKDMTISFNDSKDVVGKLVSGEVDAIAMSEPYGSEAISKLGSNAIIFRNEGLYNRTFNIVTTAKFASEHPLAIERVLRALIDAEALTKSDAPSAIQMVADEYKIPLSDVKSTWSDLVLKVSLDQSLLSALDDQARWMQEGGSVKAASIPNFLPMMYTQGLDAVKPPAVTIIR